MIILVIIIYPHRNVPTPFARLWLIISPLIITQLFLNDVRHHFSEICHTTHHHLPILAMPVNVLQQPNRATTFEKSFQDNGSNFGFYQLWWFVLSILGLTMYFAHYLGSVFISTSALNQSNVYMFPLLHRTTADALLEVQQCSTQQCCLTSYYVLVLHYALY